jgi:hypothetical protein
MESNRPGRRQHARLTFSQAVPGAVTASHDVHVLDISVEGARIEHTILLRPGGTCYLRLPLDQHVITVNCRVVWSQAVGRAPHEQLGANLLYHSGLEFGILTRDMRTVLAGYLQIRGV